MNRYKCTKLRNLGPVHGFLIHTPDDRQLKDIYPEFIVRELNHLNDRIYQLIAERDTARMQADQKVGLREEFESLLGTDKIEEGVAVVKAMKDRIKHLEDRIERASIAFFHDGTDRQTATAMLEILEEERTKQ